jgi:hypothetical protein
MTDYNYYKTSLELAPMTPSVLISLFKPASNIPANRFWHSSPDGQVAATIVKPRAV